MGLILYTPLSEEMLLEVGKKIVQTKAWHGPKASDVCA